MGATLLVMVHLLLPDTDTVFCKLVAAVMILLARIGNWRNNDEFCALDPRGVCVTRTFIYLYKDLLNQDSRRPRGREFYLRGPRPRAGLLRHSTD